MAVYWLHPTLGSDSNSGLDELNPRLTLAGLSGLLANGDGIRVAGTIANDEFVNNSGPITAVTVLWTGVSYLAFIKPWPSQPYMPILRFNYNSTNTVSSTEIRLPTIFSIDEIKLIKDYIAPATTPTQGLSFFNNGTNQSSTSFNNCKIEFANQVSTSVNAYLTNNSTMNFTNCSIEQMDMTKTISTFISNITVRNRYINNKMKFRTTNIFQAGFSTFINNKIYLEASQANTIFCQSQPTNQADTFFGNSFIINPGGFDVSLAISQLVSPNQTSNALRAFGDNIIKKETGSSGNIYFFGTNVVKPTGSQWAYLGGIVNNNMLVGLTGIWRDNAPVINYDIPTDNISFTDDTIFLSEDFSNANFLKIDPLNTNVINYILDKAVYTLTQSVGADQSSNSGGGGYPLLPAAEVKIGVDRGDGSFGTYDGSDRNTDPGEANVRFGTAYKSNSLTNNRTGSAYIPSPSDVRLGTNVDATTGTLDLPAIGDVKDGVFYDNNTKEGTYDPITGNWEAVSAADLRSGVSKLQNGSTVNGLLNIPSEANVRQGTSYDNNTKTGTLDLPAESNVRFGTNYDNATKTGSAVIPLPADVRDGVNVDATVGTLDLPLEADVKDGVDYDGNTKTGSYDPITGFWQPFSAADVRAGVQALQNGALITGLLNLPAQSDVRNGTSYDNNTKTGSAHIPTANNVRSGVNVDNTVGTLDLPSEANVRDGVFYDNNTKEGLLNIPAISDVRQGTSYDNATKTGTLDIDSEANLPDPADVLIGSGNYGENLDITPAYSPDFPDALNVRETDSTNGVQGLIPQNKIAPSQGGSYVGEESNDDIDPSIVLAPNEYLNLGETKTGTATGSDIEIIIPDDKVVYPYEYTDSEGNKTGQAGKIIEDGIDVSEQVKNNLEAMLALNFPDFEKMRYAVDPLKNDFFSNAKQFAVLNESSFDDNKLLCHDVVHYNYQIVLTNDFVNQHDDLDQRASAQLLINNMEKIRRLVKETRAGSYNTANLLWEFTFNVNTPEYIDEDKIVILRAFFSIKARVKK